MFERYLYFESFFGRETLENIDWIMLNHKQNRLRKLANDTKFHEILNRRSATPLKVDSVKYVFKLSRNTSSTSSFY